MKKSIVLILLVFSTLYCSATFWNQSRFTFYNSEDTEVYGFKNSFLSEFLIDKIDIQIQMNSLISEEDFDDVNSNVTNELRSLTTYQLTNNNKFLLGYNVDYYDYDKTGSNYIEGVGFPIQPLVKNYLYLYTQNEWEDISMLAGVRGRRTGIDINSSEAEHYDEFYKNIALAYQLNTNFSIYSTFENKSFYNSTTEFNDPRRNYDYTHYGIGLNFTSKNILGGKLSEDFQYIRKDSEQYASYQKHNFVNSLRYNFSFNSNWNSFLSYIGRFSYDKETKDFYRLANMFRIQLRYNLPDYYNRAFAIAGSRINAENLSRIYFAYFEFPLTNTISLSLEDRYSHNVYNTVISAVEYRLNNSFLLFVENNNSQSFSRINSYDFKNTITLGSRMLFR